MKRAKRPFLGCVLVGPGRSSLLSNLTKPTQRALKYVILMHISAFIFNIYTFRVLGAACFVSNLVFLMMTVCRKRGSTRPVPIVPWKWSPKKKMETGTIKAHLCVKIITSTPVILKNRQSLEAQIEIF